MRHSFLRNTWKRNYYSKEICTEKNIKRKCLISCLSSLQNNKLAKLRSSDTKKRAENLFLMPATIQISKKFRYLRYSDIRYSDIKD